MKSYNEEITAWLNSTYERLINKMSVECDRVGNKIPFIPQNGNYMDLMMPGGVHWWTNGFWPALLWQMYNATGEDKFRETASAVEYRMNEAFANPEKFDHDIGFLFHISAVANYRKTGNANSRVRGLKAAELLAGRYNTAGRFIRAWNDGGWGKTDVSGFMIIDCMMNIPLLYWATEETGDGRYAQIAKNHADTALKYIIRADGSSNHIANFNPATGEFLEAPGGQGYAPGSSWSRGQGWALYGFGLSYRHTGDKRYLETAKKCAHYCIANLAVSEWLPLVDFRAPAEPVVYDSTAGMLIAAGLLELASHVPEMEQPLYFDTAIKILRACEAKFCNWNKEEDGIVFGASMMYHNDQLAGSSIIYGDYFFAEAVLRLKGKNMFIW